MSAERIPLVVIAHASLKITSVHVSELRALYLRQVKELAGQRVIPLNYPAGSALRVEFDQRVLGMSADEVGRFWVDSRIRGLGSPPRTIPAPQLLVRSVALLPGGIGYAPATMIRDANVRVIKINGLPKPL